MGESESGRRRGEIRQGDGAYFVALMNEATRKLKWQLRNIISSAVKRVSRNCARESARFIRVTTSVAKRLQRVSSPPLVSSPPFRFRSHHSGFHCLLKIFERRIFRRKNRDFIPRGLFRYNNNRGNGNLSNQRILDSGNKFMN